MAPKCSIFGAIASGTKPALQEITMTNTDNTEITITYQDGSTFVDSRPGHTVAGILSYRDPFQRADNRSRTSTGRDAAHHERVSGWATGPTLEYVSDDLAIDLGGY